MRALEERARQAEKSAKPWMAAAAYRALLDQPESPLSRMSLLAGLARAYERENCWEGARSSLEQMECEAAARLEPVIHPTLSIGEWVRKRIRDLPLSASPPSEDSPLFSRHWQVAGQANGISVVSEAGDNPVSVRGDQTGLPLVGSREDSLDAGAVLSGALVGFARRSFAGSRRSRVDLPAPGRRRDDLATRVCPDRGISLTRLSDRRPAALLLRGSKPIQRLGHLRRPLRVVLERPGLQVGSRGARRLLRFSNFGKPCAAPSWAQAGTRRSFWTAELEHACTRNGMANCALFLRRLRAMRDWVF